MVHSDTEGMFLETHSLHITLMSCVAAFFLFSAGSPARFTTAGQWHQTLQAQSRIQRTIMQEHTKRPIHAGIVVDSDSGFIVSSISFDGYSVYSFNCTAFGFP